MCQPRKLRRVEWGSRRPTKQRNSSRRSLCFRAAPWWGRSPGSWRSHSKPNSHWIRHLVRFIDQLQFAIWVQKVVRNRYMESNYSWYLGSWSMLSNSPCCAWEQAGCWRPPIHHLYTLNLHPPAEKSSKLWAAHTETLEAKNLGGLFDFVPTICMQKSRSNGR